MIFFKKMFQFKSYRLGEKISKMSEISFIKLYMIRSNSILVIILEPVVLMKLKGNYCTNAQINNAKADGLAKCIKMITDIFKSRSQKKYICCN